MRCITNFRLGLIAAVALICVSVSADRASASVHVWSELTNNTLNIVSDDSAEKLINHSGGATVLDVGDQIVTIFQINSITVPGLKNFGVDWTNEFTGVSQIELFSKVATGGFDPFGNAIFTMVFAPTGTAVAADINPLGIAGWTPGTTIATWSDPANDFSMAGGFPVDVATATGGVRGWDFGFTGAGLESWTATGVDDFSAFAGLPPAFPGATFFFAQNVISQGAAPELIPFAPTFTDITGNGLVFNPVGRGPGWDAGDDLNIALFPVPEPSSLLVMGGLFGIGALVMSRKKKLALKS